MAEDDFEMHVVPDSKRLAQWGYSASSAQARAVFPNGRSAIYSGVSREVFEAVLNAPSVGTAFGAMVVNGGYPWQYE